jgi:type IV pilus assembly protein PilA
MKKQGFTLIELMVVIVIMGILAAVAVPKLFGMIAKSKASEVGPAAGTYVKLQQAYFSESNMAGGWQLIGYLAPNNGETTNFIYDKGDIAKDASDGVTDQKDGWKAANKANLNECQGAGATFNWTVKVQKKSGSSQDDITFTASAGPAGCVALTPTFDKIGK